MEYPHRSKWDSWVFHRPVHFRSTLVLAGLLAGVAPGQPYDESRIRTLTYPISAWNMNASRYNEISDANQMPFDKNKIIGIKVLIFSDAAAPDPEVFNLTRQGGNYLNAKKKSGGYVKVSTSDYVP